MKRISTSVYLLIVVAAAVVAANTGAAKENRKLIPTVEDVPSIIRSAVSATLGSEYTTHQRCVQETDTTQSSADVTDWTYVFINRYVQTQNCTNEDNYSTYVSSVRTDRRETSTSSSIYEASSPTKQISASISSGECVVTDAYVNTYVSDGDATYTSTHTSTNKQNCTSRNGEQQPYSTTSDCRESSRYYSAYFNPNSTTSKNRNSNNDDQFCLYTDSTGWTSTTRWSYSSICEYTYTYLPGYTLGNGITYVSTSRSTEICTYEYVSSGSGYTSTYTSESATYNDITSLSTPKAGSQKKIEEVIASNQAMHKMIVTGLARESKVLVETHDPRLMVQNSRVVRQHDVSYQNKNP